MNTEIDSDVADIWDIKKRSNVQRVELIKQFPFKVQIVLGCSWARLTLPILKKQNPENNKPLLAIEATEEYVIGRFDKMKIRSLADEAIVSFTPDLRMGRERSCCCAAGCAALAVDYKQFAVYAAVDAVDYWAANAGVSWEELYKLYLHTKGPSYSFKQEWKTSDVTALTKGIVQDRAFDRMPILSDALQDAGLEDPELFIHLQQDKCYLSDWVIWNVMGWDQ